VKPGAARGGGGRARARGGGGRRLGVACAAPAFGCGLRGCGWVWPAWVWSAWVWLGVIRFSVLLSASLCLLCGCCGLGLLFGRSRDD